MFTKSLSLSTPRPSVATPRTCDEDDVRGYVEATSSSAKETRRGVRGRNSRELADSERRMDGGVCVSVWGATMFVRRVVCDDTGRSVWNDEEARSITERKIGIDIWMDRGVIDTGAGGCDGNERVGMIFRRDTTAAESSEDGVEEVYGEG